MRLDFTVPFSRFFDLLLQNFGLFLVLGLTGIVLPALAINYGLYAYTGFGTSDWSGNMTALPPQTGLWLVGGALLIAVFQLINLSMVTEFAILRAVEKPVNVGAALGNALRNILPLIAVSILVTLMIAGGLVLLIVPGIIWALASCVAVPAYVAERGIGITGAISRSFELTRNNRWVLLAIFIVAIILLSLVYGLFGLVAAAAFMGTDALDGTGSTTMSLLQGGSVVFDALGTVLSNIFVAAIYVSLREVPGKQTASQAAAVFE